MVMTILTFPFLVRSPKDGELLGLEWGIILQVSNIIMKIAVSDESDKI